MANAKPAEPEAIEGQPWVWGAPVESEHDVPPPICERCGAAGKWGLECVRCGLAERDRLRADMESLSRYGGDDAALMREFARISLNGR